MSKPRFSVPAALGLALILLAGLATEATAQPVAQVYPVKFVCGYETGDVPLLSNPDPFPHKYEELKPGNYATLINVLNVDFTVQQLSFTPAVVIDGLGPIGFPVATTLAPLELDQIGCPEILSALTPFLPAPPVGEVFEGYVVLIVPPNDPLQVDAVYTYESKDAFDKHIVWGLGEDGVLLDFVLRLLFGGAKIGEFPPVVSDVVVRDIAASGAGGLGLGASIDVERVLPRDIITTPGGDPNAFEKFLPPKER